jgi:sugar O-acyltransferase (sialic acid O-acetyltransferase NeuD family)
MSKPNILLLGAGGHAHACIDVIEQHDQFRIAGLVGMPGEVGTKHLGYTVVATDKELPQLSKEYQYTFITVGQIQSAESRIRLYQLGTELGFNFPLIISPSAHVSRHATIGAGTIVMHGAIVNAGAKVGINCIINSHALVEHDAIVEEYCHISTGAILNGDVKIGAGSFVGSGSIIKEGVVLGKGCTIGMGLSVRHNQKDHTRFVGNDKT